MSRGLTPVIVVLALIMAVFALVPQPSPPAGQGEPLEWHGQDANYDNHAQALDAMINLTELVDHIFTGIDNGTLTYEEAAVLSAAAHEDKALLENWTGQPELENATTAAVGVFVTLDQYLEEPANGCVGVIEFMDRMTYWIGEYTATL